MNSELTVIHSATIVNEGVSIPDSWIEFENGMITAIGTGDDWCHEAPCIIDAHGQLLLPGVIDTHVHFRDPGLTRKADFASESLAAAAGGVTSVIDMPNTIPATVTMEAWEGKMKMGEEKSAVNYAFFIGATNNNLSTLLNADYSRVAGIKLFLGSSTGDMLVDSRPVIEELFRLSPALIAVHAESERLIREGRATVSARYEGKDIPLECHPEIRSRQACYESAALAVEMARKYNARLHLLHISTADELELLDPIKNRGNVTSETCPHYLWFDSSYYHTRGARVKCNPAIKEASDRDMLTRALAEGIIDTVATDHAPHLITDKEGDALHAASGMPGIETSLSVMLELAESGKIGIVRVVDAMSHRPAEIFGIEHRGFLRPGYAADMVLVKREENPSPLTDADTFTRCGWTPYAGDLLHWKVASTWVNGVQVFDGKNPRRVAGAAKPLSFRR